MTTIEIVLKKKKKEGKKGVFEVASHFSNRNFYSEPFAVSVHILDELLVKDSNKKTLGDLELDKTWTFVLLLASGSYHTVSFHPSAQFLHRV